MRDPGPCIVLMSMLIPLPQCSAPSACKVDACGPQARPETGCMLNTACSRPKRREGQAVGNIKEVAVSPTSSSSSSLLFRPAVGAACSSPPAEAVPSVSTRWLHTAQWCWGTCMEDIIARFAGRLSLRSSPPDFVSSWQDATCQAEHLCTWHLACIVFCSVRHATN